MPAVKAIYVFEIYYYTVEADQIKNGCSSKDFGKNTNTSFLVT